jgi:hypothetical protein
LAERLIEDRGFVAINTLLFPVPSNARQSLLIRIPALQENTGELCWAPDYFLMNY